MAYPVLELYARAIRSSVAIHYTADASLGGTPVPQAAGLLVTGGSGTDTTKPGVRRALQGLELPPASGLFDALAPTGTLLAVTAHVRLTSRDTIDIPMGVFDVDSERLSEDDGKLAVTAPDKWVRIQRARFVTPLASTPGIPVVTQIAALIRGALGAAEPVNITATSAAVMGAEVWEKDRDQTIINLATGIGAWVFFDRLGVATIADIPAVGATADWVAIASKTGGALTGLDRERSRTKTRNVVVVSSSSTDNPFTTQIVWDDSPTSPTYAGPDPINHPELAGPFGVVPHYWSTPLPLGDAGAQAAAYTMLARLTGLASQASWAQVPNPAADAFDVFDLLPPRRRDNPTRIVERHVADTVTHPFTFGPAQAIEGRSTGPQDVEGS